MNDILGDLNKSMDGMTSAEKSNIISTIFNKTDLSSVNALLANTGETWDSLQKSITDSGTDHHLKVRTGRPGYFIWRTPDAGH